jgi:hypothetical protein
MTEQDTQHSWTTVLLFCATIGLAMLTGVLYFTASRAEAMLLISEHNAQRLQALNKVLIEELGNRCGEQ